MLGIGGIGHATPPGKSEKSRWFILKRGPPPRTNLGTTNGGGDFLYDLFYNPLNSPKYVVVLKMN